MGRAAGIDRVRLEVRDQIRAPHPPLQALQHVGHGHEVVVSHRVPPATIRGSLGLGVLTVY
jgi:hypothetical protein